MTEDVSQLVSQIRERAAMINSLCTDYRSFYHFGPVPFEASGRMQFLRPDRIRTESTVNGKVIISIRNGTTIRRYSPTGNEMWQYDLKEIPQTQPMNLGIVDITDPFFSVEEATLQYEGLHESEGAKMHTFHGSMRVPSMEGLLDTRKGFSLRYSPQVPRIQLRLFINAETGLLLEIIGTDQAGSESFKASYRPVQVNAAVNESIFELNEPKSGYRIVEIKDILISAMNPDYADQPPSLN
jgi:outer membrane lipoprotein-sorting protein